MREKERTGTIKRQESTRTREKRGEREREREERERAAEQPHHYKPNYLMFALMRDYISTEDLHLKCYIVHFIKSRKADDIISYVYVLFP